MLKKIFLSLLAILVLLVATAIGFLMWSGAWNAIFPSSTHETVPPEMPSDLARPALLLFTKTNGFRHKEGIAAGVPLIESIAKKNNWSVFRTENSAVFNVEMLARFDAVMFHQATGDMLSDAQELAFQSWLEAGGGWFGTHAAGDGSHASWSFYQENLLGVPYIAHILDPQFQVATVNVEQADHPIMAGVPQSFGHKEEWYSWAASVRDHGFNVLATIDESTYDPTQNVPGTQNDLRMGDHPIIWTNCIGKGRTVYSTMGHAAEAYEVPEHALIIENALRWVIEKQGACR